MRRQLETLERVHLQLLVDALGEAMTEAGHGCQQLHRIGAAAQALELRPAPGPHHFEQRRSDAAPDVGQCFEARQAVAIDARGEILG